MSNCATDNKADSPDRHNGLRSIHMTARDVQVECGDTMQAMGIIFRITEVMVEDTSQLQTCQRIVDILIEETGFENASILLYDQKTDSLKLAAASNCASIYRNSRPENFNNDLAFKRDKGIAWDVFESQVPVFVSDSSQEPLPKVENAKIFPASMACLPLASVGVLNISNSVPFNFTTRKKRDLVILGSVIGNILQCSAKGERLNAYHQQLQNMVTASTLERHNANRELMASMQYLEAIIENAPMGICLIDSLGICKHLNSALRRDLGCDMAYIAGESIKKLFKDQNHYRELRNALEKCSMLKLRDIPMLRADGTIIACDVYVHPINEPLNDSQGAMVVIHHITEQKQASRQLAYVEKLRALGTMAGGIAHDFNNLLSTIHGNAELLELEITDPAQLRKIENIKIAVKDGAHSVKRLQAFTGFGTEEKYHSQSGTDIAQSIRDVIDLTRPRWKDEMEQQGITIEIDTAFEDIPPAAIHPSDLREILTNLLLNAVEAMPRGGKIEFITRLDNDRAIIEVRDNGIGMPESVCERIFDPYYSTKGVENSGLGLSVTMGLVSRSQGKIWAQSKEGEGTTFFVNLPLTATAPVEKPDESRQTRGTQLHVMAVDDEAQIVELLSMMLQEAGHKVEACTEPAKAMQLLEEKSFDIVLTDLGMPGISGWEIAEKASARKIPVVLLTGWGTQYENQDLSEKGIAAVISKPFRFNQLIEVLNSTIPSS